MPLKTRPRKTIADLHALGEEVRAELIDGELYMTPSPSLRHQEILGRLHLALGAFAGSSALGRVFVAPLDVYLPAGDVVQPDLIFVATANAGILQDRVRGVPDLLIEIVSESGAARDRIVKRDLYAKSGVAKYWIVDPDANGIEVLRLGDSGYAASGYYEATDTLTSDSLPGLSLPLADVFA